MQFWKAVNLANLQRDLDTDAEDVSKRRDESDESRKELVESTREFRANASEEVRKKVAPLIKRFQTEVDMLSKRCKGSEAAFLNLYKKLIDAPDPVPMLLAAVDHTHSASASQELEIENRKLKETIDSYRTEFAEIKNQDYTINRLKEKLHEYEEKIEETVILKVKEKERSLNRIFAEKERDFLEQKIKTAQLLGEAESQAHTFRAALDATQNDLVDVRARYDDESAAHAAEMDVLVSELDRATIKMNSLQKELEIERERLASSQNPSLNHVSSMQEISVVNLERELLNKDRQINQLIEDYREMQTQNLNLKQTTDARILSMELSMETLTTEINTLQQRLTAQSDYEENAKELAMLKGLEFGPHGDGPAVSPKRLESLLIDKNRILESENMTMKMQLNDTLNIRRELEELMASDRALLVTQTSLIIQLESDLSNIRATGEGTSTLNTTEALLGSAMDDSTTGGVPSSILPIVASQRDRFRVRNQELDTENRHLQVTLSTLRNEADVLRSDNVKLYEKIKFIQGYQGHAGSAVSIPDDTVSRYGPDYEESINPFKAFNNKERQRKYFNLSPADKFTLNLGKIVLSNKYGRLMVFIYILVVHALVFLVLYKLSHTESCKRNLAEDCVMQFAQHMHAVHQTNVFAIPGEGDEIKSNGEVTQHELKGHHAR